MKRHRKHTLHEEVTSLSSRTGLGILGLSLWLLLCVARRTDRWGGGGGAGRSLGLTIALASASVLPVALVSVVSAVCPLLRGGQQLPCLLLVLSDNGLSFLLLQLPVGHLVHIIAFFRQREVGCEREGEACGS